MKRVIEDIKTGEWKQIYLFTGSEDYLKLQYRDKQMCIRDSLGGGRPLFPGGRDQQIR